MPYIKSSHGSSNVLNQSLVHSKYVGDTAKHFDTNYVEIDWNLGFRKHLNGKNMFFGGFIMYYVPTLFLNLTIFQALQANNILPFFVLLWVLSTYSVFKNSKPSNILKFCIESRIRIKNCLIHRFLDICMQINVNSSECMIISVWFIIMWSF